MTTPPELPEEPNPFAAPDDTNGPIQPPPPPPPTDTSGYRYGPGDPRRYDSKTMLWTAGIIVLVIAVGTWLVPFIGLLVPVVLFVALFFLLAKDQTVRYRSVLAGVLLGLGLGLIVTAGVCQAVFSGTINSPLFS